MRYIEFYKIFGVRKISEIYTPKVFNKSDIVLPKYSTLYLFNIDLDIQTPKKEGVLVKSPDIVAKTLTEYKGESLGNFRFMSNKVLEYIKSCKENESLIMFPKNNSFVMKNNTVMIKNFLGLNYFYKYPSNPLLPYWRFYNILSTVVNETNNELERNIFIPLKLEVDLKYVNFRILMDKKMTSGLLNRLPSYDILIMFELWKYIDPKTYEQSIFSKIKPENTKNINFILTTKNKCSIINLEILMSVIMEFKEKFNYKINKLPSKTFSKLLYLMFKKITLTDNITIPEIDVNKITDTDNDNDIIDFRKLDEDLENEMITLEVEDEYEEVKLSDEDVDQEGEIINNNDIESLEIKSKADNITKLEEVNIKVKPQTKLNDKITSLKDNGLITKNRSESYIKILEEQDNIPIVINNTEVKLKDVIDYKHKFELSKEETEITPNKVNKDKNELKNIMVNKQKKYIKEDHEVMLVKTLMSVQNSDFIINNIDIKNDESILGKTSTYSIEVNGLDGSKSTLSVIIPKVDEDGTYKLSQNNYILRNQRASIPIRKESYNMVSLNSYYGKLFITRGLNKNNDLGYWLRTQLLKEYANNRILNLIVNTSKYKLFDKNIPEDYTIYGRYIKSFKFEDYYFNFNYDNRLSILENKTLINKLETDGILLGTKSNNPIVMRYDNLVYEFKDNKYHSLGYLEEIINLDLSKAPLEFISMKIFKTNVPLVLLLGYYYGIEKLLRLYNVNYYYEKSNVKIDKDKYLEIKFSEDKLIIKKNKKTDSLLNGLYSLNDTTKYVKRLNTKNDFDILFNLLDYSLLVKNEISLLDNMFVDPMTLEVLKILKLPETFRGLLIKSVEMLLDNKYSNPNDIEGTILKGYERFSGFLYKELVISIREQKNKSTFGKAKLSMNPYSIIKKLNEDSTTMLVNDINPIANLKQYEDVTYLGALFGRSRESMSKDTRQYDDSDIGIFSEANKDSGDVGISAYVSASPNVVNTLGMLEKSNIENMTWSSVLSTSAMLAPFGINDDVKRLVFSGIQNEHVIPTLNMNIPYVRTPHDIVIASKIQGKYAEVAENDGEVIKIDKDKITIKYITKDKSYNKDYKLYDWYSKVESNATYKHTIVSNVVKGEKIKKDDVICYDKAFFTPDVYDKRRVVYIQSTLLNTAFIDDIDTYEDSTTLSYEASELMSIESIKIRSIQLKNEDNIIGLMNIGDNIIPTSILFTITNQIIDTKDLDEEAIEVLKNMNSFSPKAKYKGKIDNIVVFYNCNFEDLSPTLKEIVKVSDEKLLKTTGHTGKVNASYSIKGKPLLDGDIEIKIYLSTHDDMGIADKMIWGNQLKCTVGGLFKSIKTFDTEEKVDALFSSMSINKRITPSAIKMGILGSCCKKTQEDAVDLYFS